jgi:hypothetical protein
MTWARAMEPSDLTRYSTVGGWLLNLPFRAPSALEMALSTWMDGFEEAMFAKAEVSEVHRTMDEERTCVHK